MPTAVPAVIEATSIPDLTEQTEVRDHEVLSILDEACPPLIAVYAESERKDLDFHALVVATAEHHGLTLDDANELLRLCSIWGKAMIETYGK